MRDNKIAYFNILKITAALCVSVLFHYQDHFLISVNWKNPFSGGSILYVLSQNSNMFVELFFIISGLLFQKIYVERIENGQSFHQFMLRRILRLYPVMLATIFVMYILQGVIIHQTGAGWNEEATISLKALFVDCVFAGPVWINGSMTQNAPIWYISVLLVCYMVAFGITKLRHLLISKYHLSGKTTGLLFACPFILGILMRYILLDGILWNRYISRGYISFFLGIFLGVFLELYPSCSKKAKAGIKTVCVIMILLVMLLYNSGLTAMVIDDLSFTLCIYVFPALIVVLYNINWLNRICSMKIPEYLGKISFGIYIWNFPIFAFWYLLYINGCLPWNPASYGFVGVNILVHLIIAVLSYECIEKRLTDRLISFLKEKRIL